MKKQKRRSIWKPYWQSMLDLFEYQFVVTILLLVILQVLRTLAGFVLRSTGRVAVSSGDFMFLFTSWQGILLLLFGLTVFFVYLAFDINTKIIYAGKLIEGKPDRIRSTLKESLLSIRAFLCPEGLLIVLYIALIAPLVGVGVSMALTRDLYIPAFITSVIESTPIYYLAYVLVLLVFAYIGIRNLFCIHGVIIDKMSVRDSIRYSRELVRKNWRNHWKQTLLFGLNIAAMNVLLFLIFAILVTAVVAIFVSIDASRRFLYLFILLTGAAVFSFFNSYVVSFYMLRMTELYYRYSGKEKSGLPVRASRFHPFVWLGIAVALVLVIVGSWGMERNFDRVFPADSGVRLIAHRAGGKEAPENTVAGIDAAAEAGVYGSEVDIQRTLDGYYIINHDATFSRLSGVNKKPEEMTLAEIRELEIHDPNHPDKIEKVATFEEILDASKDRLVLFVELKGDSADPKMVDDAVTMIEEKGMQDQCVLISLKYDLIDYAETKYPQMKTAYLTFLTFGDTAALNCDYLGLEEESATEDMIERMHEQGKGVLVWTPNEENAQKKFLLSEADAIITDNVYQAQELQKQLGERSDIARIMDRFFE